MASASGENGDSLNRKQVWSVSILSMAEPGFCLLSWLLGMVILCQTSGGALCSKTWLLEVGFSPDLGCMIWMTLIHASESIMKDNLLCSVAGAGLSIIWNDTMQRITSIVINAV